ncbi:MAG: Sec-independent protein translocase protein TatB [Alphaproteobacteria bacterium]
MLDVGWQELFIIAVVTILVVGPKEIPRVLRTVSLWTRKIKSMAREFQSSIDDLARETELDDIKKELQRAKDFDLERDIEDAIDPTGEMSNSIRDIEKSMDTPEKPPGPAKASIVKPEKPSETEAAPPAVPAAKPAGEKG